MSMRHYPVLSRTPAQHMDKDKNGKVTLSEMEDAALSLGFSLEQAHRIFAKCAFC